MATAPRTTIQSLQAGRGLAACAVVLHHSDQAVHREIGQLPYAVSVVFSKGYLGVDFFFVLSGFIIYYVNWSRSGRPGWARAYWENRLLRIFVPYLPVGLSLAIAYSLLPHMMTRSADWNWFTTLTLIPVNGYFDGGSALALAWTLQHELAFYLVIFLCLYFDKLLVGSIISVSLVVFLATFYPTFRVSFLDIEFLFGGLAAWCFVNQRARNNILLACIGSILLLLFLLSGADRSLSVVFGLGLAFLILPIVRLEVAGRLRIGAFLLLLGNASYSIYLVHQPVISLLTRLMRSLDPLVALLVTVIVPVGAAIIFHIVYETPALEVAKRTIRHRTLVKGRASEVKGA